MHDLFDLPERRSTVNSKLKGNRGELSACKALKKWSGMEFNRVPNSGGLRWKNSQKVVGDIICESEIGWVFEVKNYKEFHLTPVLRHNSIVLRLYKQVYSDAVRSGKWPMLMLRNNGMPAEEFLIFISSSVGVGLDISPEYVGKGPVFGSIVGYKLSELSAKVAFKVFVDLSSKNKFVS